MSDEDAGDAEDVEDVDLPSNVDAALTELVENARTHARDGDTDRLVEAVDTMAAVAGDELPEGDRRERFLHGCERVAEHAGDDYAVATEYLRAMEALVE